MPLLTTKLSRAQILLSVSSVLSTRATMSRSETVYFLSQVFLNSAKSLSSSSFVTV